MRTQGQKKQILIVEDDHSTRELYQDILSKGGYAIQMARSGVQALKKIKKENFNLILLDLKLPGLNGIETLKKIKTMDPCVSVLLVTAFGSISSATEALKNGAYDYLPKTFHDFNEIYRKIKEGLKLEEKAREKFQLERRQIQLAVLGEAMARVAHELGNPLTSLAGYIQLAPHKYNQPGFRDKFITRLNWDIERLLKIRNDLLCFAKGAKATLRSISLSHLIKDIVNKLKTMEGYREIQFQIKVPSSLKAVGDDQALTQAFINLIQNAAQAMKGKGTIAIAARIGEYAQILIQDNGPGIAPENLEKIFEPFFTTKPQGTGLGLSIVKQIIEAHGGSIKAESSKDKGAVFVIELPRRIRNTSHIKKNYEKRIP